MSAIAEQPVRRALFVLTILAGSFLLFLIQPMVARLALPQLGGAPNVWNSAMLVYQALLLGGYAYAHWLGRFAFSRQAQVHLALLLLAGLTLPVALADLPPPAAGMEALWAPLLFLLTIGPVFFVISAQAPLMQRWFATHPRAGEPWALYAASNLGSFAGLIAYPLLAEPLLRLREQSLAWSFGYILLIILVALTAWARWNGAPPAAAERAGVPHLPIGVGRIMLWLALAAVPSGLMLSTTTHLTTDIFAMPLLWVIPLGLYLLSFVIAFSDRRTVAWAVTLSTPTIVLLAGGLAMTSRSSGSMVTALASIALLFVLAVALHARLYDLRPDASRLTLFYLVMSAGGALGGLFTALIAPLLFDWVWEHPLLVLAGAALMPLIPLLDWRRMPGLSPEMAKLGAWTLFAFAIFLAWNLAGIVELEDSASPERLYLTLGIAAVGLLLVPWRHLFLGLLALLMLAQGGQETIRSTVEGVRTRSYFGIYTVRDYPGLKMRTLAHGTTLHGEQSLDPAHRLEPTTYYGASSGVGIVLSNAQRLFGDSVRTGVVGLGTGTLSCYHKPGMHWDFFEIDPAVVAFSRSRTFTFLQDCAPGARIRVGDARIELAKARRGGFDLLVIDAFSSDAIPLHLLTREAFGVYFDAVAPSGLLLVHISNRFIELEPVIAAEAKRRGLHAMVRKDSPSDTARLTASSWVIVTRDPRQFRAVQALAPEHTWNPLMPPAPRGWTDDHASILPYIRWQHLLGKSQD